MTAATQTKTATPSTLVSKAASAAENSGSSKVNVERSSRSSSKHRNGSSSNGRSNTNKKNSCQSMTVQSPFARECVSHSSSRASVSIMSNINSSGKAGATERAAETKTATTT